jgi:hypothetical protein
VPYASHRRRRLGGFIVLLGAILLVASLFVGWWMIQVSGFGLTETVSLGFPATNGGNGISAACSGNDSSFTSHCPSPETYSSASLNNTGKLYNMVQFLVLGGVLLGLLGALLALGFPGSRSGLTPGIVLVVLAMIVALVAPVWLTVSQPGAMKSDYPTSTIGGNGTNPSNTFWGSNSSDGVVYTWGANTGWYLSLVAFALFVAALFVLRTPRTPKMDDTATTTGIVSEMQPPSSLDGNALSNLTDDQSPAASDEDHKLLASRTTSLPQ